MITPKTERSHPSPTPGLPTPYSLFPHSPHRDSLLPTPSGIKAAAEKCARARAAAYQTFQQEVAEIESQSGGN